MNEEIDVGTDRVQDTIEKHQQRVAGDAGRESHRARWLDSLAISTALFAVLGAVAALQAGAYANEALFTANKAVLQQARAVDAWMCLVNTICHGHVTAVRIVKQRHGQLTDSRMSLLTRRHCQLNGIDATRGQ